MSDAPTVVIPEYIRNRTAEGLPMVKDEIAIHKNLFDKNKQYFMGIQPDDAWKYMDEGTKFVRALYARGS